jgi:hypothetical protein
MWHGTPQKCHAVLILSGNRILIACSYGYQGIKTSKIALNNLYFPMEFFNWSKTGNGSK